MTASLYTALGSYNTLQSLMGSIVELVIKMLVMLSLLILGMWATPVTWPMATTMSAVFLAISVPLALIAAFMTKVLHVSSSGVPGLPKMRCFAPETWVNVYRDRERAWVRVPMENLSIGDIIEDESQVTAILQLSAQDLDMYTLGEYTVSGNHRVWFAPRQEWVAVKDHPFAAPLVPPYPHAHVYCLTTTSHVIQLGPFRFMDWDECSEPHKMPLSVSCGSGLEPATQVHRMRHGWSTLATMDEIQLGDVLVDSPGSVSNQVYGVVWLPYGRRHLLTTHHRFSTAIGWVEDFDDCFEQWQRYKQMTERF